MDILLTLVLMLGVIGLVSFLSQKVAIPAPVLLAVAGVGWSLIPGFRPLQFQPEVVLSVFLPPLLYADAWAASWLDFRRWLRPILQLAIGLVLFTTLVVGVAAKWALPELPWAACFMLGAIVSPTDTVAVHAVLDRLRVPRRATAILGGESLINDATGLLVAGLALVVVMTGVFELEQTAISFAGITGTSVVIGVAIGVAAAALNYLVRGTPILFVFSLLAPYTAFYLAEHAGASAVLAVVIAGFVASWRMHYIAPESRVDLYAAWSVLAFLLNALMFLYIGLETPDRLRQAFETVPGIVAIALLISAAAIVARFVFIFPSAYLPLWLWPKLREREGGYPTPKGVTLVAWCGLRGAVSLAAALSIPGVLPDGSPFPGREAIIACTLTVILATLVGQGMTLLPLARRLGVSDADLTEAEVRRAREAMLSAGIARLDGFCADEKCPVAVFRFRDIMADQLASLQAEDEMAREQATRRVEVANDVRRAVYQAQAEALLALRDQGVVNDSVHQDLQLDLDRANVDVRSPA